MDYSAAKADAEKDGTEKAERTKKVIRRVIQVGGGVVIVLLLTVALHQFMDYWKHHKAEETAQATSFAASACSTFSTSMHWCRFSTGIAWASTGKMRGLLPCILPLPMYGNYTLWQGDTESRPTVWTPNTPAPFVNVYGFQAPPGQSRRVGYKLVRSPSECHS